MQLARDTHTSTIRYILLGMATTTVEMARRVGGTKRKYSILRKVVGSGWVLKRRGELVLRRDEVGLALSLVFPPRQCYRTEMWAAA